MDRHIAFLRGMNLGGRRLENEQLRREFEALGFTDVACFRASGNVVFAAGKGGEAELTKRIEAGLGDFDAAAQRASKGKLQVAFLLEKPRAPARRQALALASDDDRLAIDGRELYWLPRGGMSESELDLNAIGAALGLTTIRTKGTVEQIVARYFD